MPDLRAFDEPDLRDLARAARAGGPAAADAFLTLLRRIRELGRHDLASPCRLLWPSGASGEALAEMLQLYLDAGFAGEGRQLLSEHLDLKLTLQVPVLLSVMEALPAEPRGNPRTVWPDESLPYAAKTSIFQVQESIIVRQRALIEMLLARASGQAKAG